MALLAGIHDREGRHIVPPGGWCLDTIALSENPPYTDYAHLMPGINWIVRLNWGYGSTGTLPVSERYADFADRVVAYVAHSPGCSRWIIGNEPNLSREWPNGKPIMPWDYAECYLRCRAAIHALPGHERDEVLIAAPGPWNAELRYTGNPNGDWIQYFVDVFEAVGSNCDGFSLHAYTHGYDPALVTSEKRMDSPFENRHYEFRTYKDYLAVVPFQLRELPVYITEANGNGPWEARGLMPAMLREISEHNESGGQPISCLVFYRYPRYDEFHMEGKADVLAEFQQAAQRQWAVPVPFVPDSTQEQNYMPQVSTGPSVPTLPIRDWDERLTQRGVSLTVFAPQPGQQFWRVVRGKWLDEQESQGRHHIYVDVLDEAGNRVPGVPLTVSWPSGSARIVTEAKPGEPYAANYPMSPSRNEFSVRVDDGQPSETVKGIGMGADTPGGFNAGVHTSTFVTFQRAMRPATSQPQPAPVEQPMPSTVPPLTHPIEDPGKRVISQRFGDNPAAYARFNMAGHNGLDFAVPVGTPVRAVDDGVAVEMLSDVDGYGQYIKLRHSWGESLYAHLDRYHAVAQGAHVKRGQVIGLSGNSGNSTGPHLHLGIRVNPYTRGAPYDGYSDPEPLLANTSEPVTPQPTTTDIPAAIKSVATEFGLQWELIASLAWAESSFNPRAESKAGAKGLMQIMQPTWDEWAARVGAADIWNPTHNLRVGCAYLAWLLRYFKGNEHAALAAYNWGVGNVERSVEVPEATELYIAKVRFGRDLLKAVSA